MISSWFGHGFRNVVGHVLGYVFGYVFGDAPANGGHVLLLVWGACPCVCLLVMRWCNFGGLSVMFATVVFLEFHNFVWLVCVSCNLANLSVIVATTDSYEIV